MSSRASVDPYAFTREKGCLHHFVTISCSLVPGCSRSCFHFDGARLRGSRGLLTREISRSSSVFEQCGAMTPQKGMPGAGLVLCYFRWATRPPAGMAMRTLGAGQIGETHNLMGFAYFRSGQARSRPSGTSRSTQVLPNLNTNRHGSGPRVSESETIQAASRSPESAVFSRRRPPQICSRA